MYINFSKYFLINTNPNFFRHPMYKVEYFPRLKDAQAMFLMQNLVYSAFVGKTLLE